MTGSIPTFTVELYEENGQYKKRVTAPDDTRLDPVDLDLAGRDAHSSVVQRFQERGVGRPDELKRLGEWLYSLLFDRETERLYDVYLGKSVKQMRLRLIIDAEELDRLPWEMIRDGSRDIWLATLSDRPLTRNTVRRRPPARVPPAREAGSPLKVLIVSASPGGLDKQPIKLMLERLAHHIADLQMAGEIVVKTLEQATLEAITRANEERCDIFLFVGYGQAGNRAEPSAILLHDEVLQDEGLRDEVGSQAQRRVLASELGQQINDNLPRMVFLAACQTSANTPDGGTGFARALLNTIEIPVVVAMQTFIGDSNAGDLTGWFLRNAAQGEPVDVALAIARKALIHGNTPPGPDVFSGVMYLQSSDADVFELGRAADAHPAPLKDTKSETRGDTVATGKYTIHQEAESFKVSWEFSVTKNSRSGTGKGSMSLRLLDANGRGILEATRTLTVGANPLRPSSTKEASEENLISQMPANVLFDVNAESDTSGIP